MWQAFLHLDAVFGRAACRARIRWPVRRVVGFVRVCGHPMHSRNAVRLRLIQALTVPSGVPRLVEISRVGIAVDVGMKDAAATLRVELFQAA